MQYYSSIYKVHARRNIFEYFYIIFGAFYILQREFVFSAYIHTSRNLTLLRSSEHKISLENNLFFRIQTKECSSTVIYIHSLFVNYQYNRNVTRFLAKGSDFFMQLTSHFLIVRRKILVYTYILRFNGKIINV